MCCPSFIFYFDFYPRSFNYIFLFNIILCFQSNEPGYGFGMLMQVIIIFFLIFISISLFDIIFLYKKKLTLWFFLIFFIRLSRFQDLDHGFCRLTCPLLPRLYVYHANSGSLRSIYFFIQFYTSSVFFPGYYVIYFYKNFIYVIIVAYFFNYLDKIKSTY